MDFQRLFAPFLPPSTHLVDRLRYWADETPEQTAFFFWTGDEQDETPLSFRQLDQQARAIAAELTARRLHGQRALLLYPPGLDFVAGLCGCLYAGVIAVPAYPPRRSRNMERIEAISEDAQAAVVLSTHEITHRPPVEHAPHLRRIPWIATNRLPQELAEQWEPPAIDSASLAILQYTSGSTGAPKGVILSHGNLIHNCELIAHGFEASRNTMGLFWLPTYHDMGLVGGILEPLFLGCPSVLMPPLSFLQKPVRWLRGISRFRATISGGPNFAFALCNEKVSAEECAGLDLSSWEVAFNGAEPIRAETLEAFTRKFAPYGFRGHTHYPCYGMAETTLLVTGGAKRKPPVLRGFDSAALDDHRVVPVKNGKNGHGKSGPQPAYRKLVSSGRVLPGDELAIVDPETCTPVAEGRVGEIWVSSPSVAQGYWNKPEETARVFGAQLPGRTDEFLRTGDLGFFHDGELFVTGRCKDLIIIRGRNLYPHDVELTVEKCHPALRTAGGACFSIEVAGEERLIVVQELQRQQPQGDAQAIIAAIREAVLDEHEAPLHSVCLLRTGKLPKTSSGKVQRRACREAYLQGALESQAQWTEDIVERRVEAEEPKPATASDKSSAAIQSWLASRIAAKLRGKGGWSQLRPQALDRDNDQPQLTPDPVDVREPFARFGLDSLALVELSGELEAYLGRSVSPTVLYSYPTIAELANHLGAPQTPHEQPAADRNTVAEPIAIVGLACRFPGASDPTAFWELLRDGRDATGEVPVMRWDVERYYNADPAAAGGMYTRRGGFIDGVDQFDPHFFGIAPREAAAIDPQQRLLLEVAWETLENGAIPPDKLAGSSLGVFVGISNGDYSRLQSGRELSQIDAYSGTGNAFSIAAGRLAYVLGVHGPCLAVDTACSSSLVAVHLAMQSLRRGECRAALAGGVNLMLDPSSTVALCRLQALAPDGRCKTFDASADGYGRGEGCGLVLLKRLSDAIDDGDPIWAVLRGSAVNHDGRSNGLTAPHGPSQEALLRAALADAQVRPTEVGYLEAHGTGTSLGDPIEVQAISAVLGSERDEKLPLLLGSVKTNIGHLEAAAGIAGLIKAVLSLASGEIPPHLHLQTPNPYIPWDQIPVQVPRERIAWPEAQRRRIAGVSSFGFSGTNAHLIVEESPQPRNVTPPVDEQREQLLVLSAKDDAALRELAGRYARLLAEPAADLAAICQTAALGRQHFAHRLAVLAEDAAEAVAELENFARGERSLGVFHGKADEHRPPKIACLFTGQGSQFVNMAHSLYQANPTFRAALDRCEAVLRDQLPLSLFHVLFGPDDPAAPVHQTRYTQPALFAVEFALCELWKSWGIQPMLSLGHSSGEYVAACALGVLSLEDALRLVAARGRLMQELPAEGAMVAIAADEKRVGSVLHAMNGQIDVAAVNSPVQTVISGPAAAIDQAAIACEGAGLRTSRLRVSHAFHSALMEPMLDEFERLCREVTFHAPTGEMAANVSGRIVTDEIAAPEYWRQQIRGTVRFADCLTALDARGVDIFLEIGPKPILTPAGRQTLPDRGQLWLASLRPGKDDWTQLLECVAELYIKGAPLDWAGFYKDQPKRRAALPNYPFQRSRYWIDVEVENFAGSRLTPAPRPGSDQHESIDDWLFEVQWQPRSRFTQALPRSAADYLPDSAALSRAVQPESDRLRRQFALPRYVELLAAQDELSAAYVAGALAQLGWQPAVGDQFSTAGLAERLGVAGRQRLLGRLLEMLAEDGYLAPDASGWRVTAIPPDRDPAAMQRELLARHAECSAELSLLASCGGGLAGVLRGETDPLQLLFPGGSTDLVERLYRDSPFARSLNALLEETLSRAIADLPPGRALKILEVGAGTGGTTARLLPRQLADRTEYVFTDVSQVFMHEAAAKFRQFPFVRYAPLDIETSPAEQGFAPGQFDIIIAANVMHATRDLRQSLANVNQLLAPQGALVLLEGTRPQRWLDLIFGLTEGWWRFAEDGVRDKHPLVCAATWQRLLGEQGFTDFAVLPAAADDAQPGPPQAVFVARTSPAAIAAGGIAAAREEAEVAKWLILADQAGVGDALAGALEAAGHECALLHADRSRDLPGLLESHDFQGIVHLWSLDVAPAEELNADTLLEAQWLACESAVEVLQELIAQASPTPPRLWFATRGAQAVLPDDEVLGLAQSPLWGLARAVEDEQPALLGGLVDLDPAASPTQAAGALVEELLRPDDEDQVAYRADQRYAARLVRRTHTSGTLRKLPWRTDASYLITGGLGDIGLRVAEWMADRGAHHLILTGRTPLPPRDQWDEVAKGNSRQGLQIKVLRQLEARGVTIRTAAADVSDEAAMRSLLNELAEVGWPPIRGVFHAAGLADAGPLTAVRTERVAEVMGPKMTGGWVLHKLLQSERLDFFVCCSSGAAILPTALMGVYAAASTFPTALAHYRRAKGLPALTVHWGFWEQTANLSASVRGLDPGVMPAGTRQFSADQGLAAWQKLHEQDAIATGVMPVDLIEWQRHHPEAARSSLFANLRLTEGSAADSPAAQEDKNATDSIRATIAAAAPAERRPLAEGYLRDRISRVLRMPPEKLDTQQSLNNLGIDSLMAVELRNHVQAHLGVAIPLAKLLQDPTIGQLAQVVLDQIEAAPQTPAAAAAAPTAASAPPPPVSTKPPETGEVSAQETLAQLQDLSDEEVDALLRQMLSEEEQQA